MTATRLPRPAYTCPTAPPDAGIPPARAAAPDVRWPDPSPLDPWWTHVMAGHEQ